MTGRKSMHCLTPADLRADPVWRYELIMPPAANSGEWVWPTEFLEHPDDPDATYIVRTRFELADGDYHVGFCSVYQDEPELLDQVQPVIVTDRGVLPFWFDFHPGEAPEAIAKRVLGKTPDAIFPVAFESEVRCHGHFMRGTIEEFEIAIPPTDWYGK